MPATTGSTDQFAPSAKYVAAPPTAETNPPTLAGPVLSVIIYIPFYIPLSLRSFAERDYQLRQKREHEPREKHEQNAADPGLVAANGVKRPINQRHGPD